MQVLNTFHGGYKKAVSRQMASKIGELQAKLAAIEDVDIDSEGRLVCCSMYIDNVFKCVSFGM